MLCLETAVPFRFRGNFLFSGHPFPETGELWSNVSESGKQTVPESETVISAGLNRGNGARHGDNRNEADSVAGHGLPLYPGPVEGLTAGNAMKIVRHTVVNLLLETMSYAIDLSTLNPEQREAVEHRDGPLLLLAGAGTGKTRVIVHRIANLIAHGIDPAHILAVTFTNKAAREMRERVSRLLSPNMAETLTMGTFHSFCGRILRKHAAKLGYSVGFGIATDSYQQGLIRTVMTELGQTGEGKDPALWLAEISRAKSALLSPDDLRTREDLKDAAAIAEVYTAYQERLFSMNHVDFDDLLCLVHRLWTEFPEVLAAHRDRYRYLMIDEYQDTNTVQFRLMATLAGPTANLCVVGDDDQSIYAWRGADLRNILDFEYQFPGAKVIRLEQNYRSTTTILRAANAVISRNRQRKEKALWSRQSEGKPLLCVRCEDENKEAQFVADLIRERQFSNPGVYGQTAVLFRSNHQSRALENAFRQARIPYRMIGTNSFYQRKEILDAVSLLNTLANERDDLSLLRIVNVPPRGIGDTSLGRLREFQKLTGQPLQRLLVSPSFLAEISPRTAEQVQYFHRNLVKWREEFSTPGSLRERVEAYFTSLDYLNGLARMYKPRADAIRRRENVLEFLNAVAEFEQTHRPRVSLEMFLENFALMDSSDREERAGHGNEEAVTLMTVHAAKGLEYPLVFLIGLERGLFPHLRAIKEHTEEEERRLFYVAITRAKEELVLVYAEKRRTQGQIMRRRPSPFLDELPPELVCFSDADKAIAPATAKTADAYIAQMKAMFGRPEN